MYRSKQFTEKPLGQVLNEITWAAEMYPKTERVFLADGDALTRSVPDLQYILEALYQAFPCLGRVSSYALPNNFIKKTSGELALLRQSGLLFLYYGIESGSANILKRITKGATTESMVEGLNKASYAGLVISATVILGLGGQRFWEEHIDETAKLVNRTQLDYLSTLQLTLEPVIREEFVEKFQRKGGVFIPQDDAAILQEQIRLIEKIMPGKELVFRSNHASNALPLKGVLPSDRNRLLSELNEASIDSSILRPGWMRGL
jgi:radical SAM superfamily enzyme YgiQ (UPF0313 family)